MVFAVAEIFTLTAALALLGAHALIASVSAMIGLPVPLQLVVFGPQGRRGHRVPSGLRSTTRRLSRVGPQPEPSGQWLPVES